MFDLITQSLLTLWLITAPTAPPENDPAVCTTKSVLLVPAQGHEKEAVEKIDQTDFFELNVGRGIYLAVYEDDETTNEVIEELSDDEDFDIVQCNLSIPTNKEKDTND